MSNVLSRLRLVQWLAVSAFVLAVSHAQAANFSFSGAFTSDDDVHFIPFVLDSAQTVTIRTWSYAGGTNAAGALIPAGGFDPILSLFTAAGAFVALSDDGLGVDADPVTADTPLAGDPAHASDSLLELLLGAGSYLVALSQYDNFPNGDLADGFSAVGSGNFTPALALASGAACSAAQFCDYGGNARTGNFAVDLIGVSRIPEPPSPALILLGLAGFAATRRRPRT